jgi:hypothetical protein
MARAGEGRRIGLSLRLTASTYSGGAVAPAPWWAVGRTGYPETRTGLYGGRFLPVVLTGPYMRRFAISIGAAWALGLLAGCGGLSPMLKRPDEAVSGRHLVVFVPDTMDVWGREQFEAVLHAGSSLGPQFRNSLQTELRKRIRFERVDVRLLPETLVLTRQRFRLVERRHETVRLADLPPAGDVVQVDGEAPDYVVFMDRIDLERVRPVPPVPVIGAPLGGGVTATLGTGGRVEHGASWNTTVTLWDNRAGAPVLLARAQGFGAFRNQHAFDAGDVTATTWAESIADLVGETAEALHLAQNEAEEE